MIPVVIPIPRVDTEKTPSHVGEGFLQGINKFGDHVSTGARTMWNKPQEGHRESGAMGAAKGVGEGLLGLAAGVGKGACDFVGSTLEGVRHTPDAIADRVNKERKHNRHGVEGDGKGELLETFCEENQEPEHVGTGIVTGVKCLGKGLASGLKDLRDKPLEGAKDAGTIGFAKGLGQGVMGLGTKAASGTLDLATNFVSGVKNTPEAIGKKVQAVTARQGATTSSANLTMPQQFRIHPSEALRGPSSSGESSSSSKCSNVVSSHSGPPTGTVFSGEGRTLGSQEVVVQGVLAPSEERSSASSSTPSEVAVLPSETPASTPIFAGEAEPIQNASASPEGAEDASKRELEHGKPPSN